jgi:hypothetical protein
MPGIAFTSTQPNGVQTTWATVIDISWQPGLSADVQIGFFLNESSFTPGCSPVATQYFPLNIGLINPALAIPGQIFSQLIAAGAPLAGGTITS